ncbi:hypothetical protein ACO0K9_20275 [Undibacterium sp. Ji50W]|uniref:hypothetical protein n=1 Tax=Undibacterium sp. Ji50W TaxID=3413041 RepID=UPI003BF3FAE0
MNRNLILALFLQLTSTPIFAEDKPNMSQEPVENQSVVDVTGTKNADWKSYSAMLKGITAFNEHHKLAPKSELRFILRKQLPNAEMQGIVLRIVGTEKSISVPIAEDGTFSLLVDKNLAEDNAELVLNRKKDMVRWLPHIITPNLPENVRRLGDLRLECEVRWAVEKEGMSFFQRNSFKALGGPCSSSVIKTDFYVPKLAVSAKITFGSQTAEVQVAKTGARFTPPLYDKNWNDDALIEFQFKGDSQPVSSSQ